MITEAYQALVELAAVSATGAYSIWPVEAGPHPMVYPDGYVAYGAPVPRATWRLALPVEVTPGHAQVSLPVYRIGYTTQVRG